MGITGYNGTAHPFWKLMEIKRNYRVIYFRCDLYLKIWLFLIFHFRIIALYRHERTVGKVFINISIVSSLAVSLFWAIMPFLGWSYYSYEGLGVSCSIEWNERSFSVISYNVTILLLTFILPLTCILLADGYLIFVVTRSFNIKRDNIEY